MGLYNRSVTAQKSSPQKLKFTPRTQALAAAISVCLYGVPSAQAETFTVSNFNTTGAGSLTQAVSDANDSAGADNIIFSVADGIINFGSGDTLEITESLSITGPGAASITLSLGANDGGDLINVSDEADLTVQGLTLTKTLSTGRLIANVSEPAGSITIRDSVLSNSSSDPTMGTGGEPGAGGAIFSSGNLTIERSVVTGHISQTHGGAIYTDGGITTIQESEFSGNTSTGYCGAICAVGGAVIEGSTFSGNTAGQHGGAILVADGNLSIEGSTFSGNAAGGRAGAVHARVTNIIIEGSTFSGNTAGGTAGAVYASVDNIFIEGSTFSGNSSLETGGAVFALANSISIVGSVFSGNSAEFSGAVYASGGSGDIGILNSSFSGNTAAPFGAGAVYAKAEGGTVNIVASTFSGNSSEADGGALVSGGAFPLRMINCVFSGNRADNGAGGGTGGAIYLSSGVADFQGVDILGTTIVGNHAAVAGGGIASTAGVDFATILINSVVANNTAANTDRNDLDGHFLVDYSLIGIADNVGEGSIIENTPWSSMFGTLAEPADPELGPLQDNGGTRIGANGDAVIQSIMPLDGSLLIDIGDETAGNSLSVLPAYDIRGEGYPRVVNALDIGATEFYLRDTTPETFSFMDAVDVDLATLIESDEIIVREINVAVSIDIERGEYSINGGEYSTEDGAVEEGDRVNVRHTSSGDEATVVETMLSIGGVSAVFRSTTESSGSTQSNSPSGGSSSGGGGGSSSWRFLLGLTGLLMFRRRLVKGRSVDQKGN